MEECQSVRGKLTYVAGVLDGMMLQDSHAAQIT